MTPQFLVLDRSELLEFFGSDPIEASDVDGFACYEVTDGRGVTMRFSFDALERSVQTVISVAGLEVSTVSHEGAERMVIRDGQLRCEFASGEFKTNLTIDIAVIFAKWSTLRLE